jgi:hypothetical protein
MSRMLEMLRDLIAHKGHANAALLTGYSAEPRGSLRSRAVGAAPPHPARQSVLAAHCSRVTVRLRRRGPPLRFVRRTHPSIRQYSGAGGHVARDRDGGRACTDSGRRSHSEWQVFRLASAHAGMHALAWPSGSVCEATSATWRRATTDRLHSVADESPISGVGRKARACAYRRRPACRDADAHAEACRSYRLAP